jgi:hypothetical protein
MEPTPASAVPPLGSKRGIAVAGGVASGPVTASARRRLLCRHAPRHCLVRLVREALGRREEQSNTVEKASQRMRDWLGQHLVTGCRVCGSPDVRVMACRIKRNAPVLARVAQWPPRYRLLLQLLDPDAACTPVGARDWDEVGELQIQCRCMECHEEFNRYFCDEVLDDLLAFYTADT